MPNIQFLPLPTEQVRALQAGGPDANGQTPERHISDGSGLPCRHCLEEIAQGEPYLILSYRPFGEDQPFAERGPIFLHANPCRAYQAPDRVPPMFLEWDRLLIRGYGADDRIVYGSGHIVETPVLASAAAEMLHRPDIAYIHVRSASNNCFQCRIERGAG